MKQDDIVGSLGRLQRQKVQIKCKHIIISLQDYRERDVFVYLQEYNAILLYILCANWEPGKDSGGNGRTTWYHIDAILIQYTIT